MRSSKLSARFDAVTGSSDASGRHFLNAWSSSVTPSSLLVLGARSDVGRAIARRFAETGYSVTLAARRSDNVAADVTDLVIRYKVAASAVEFDVTDGRAKCFFD